MISFDRLRYGKYCYHVAKRSSRPEIKIILSRLKDAGIARKMALHTDIVTTVGLYFFGIHNGRIERALDIRVYCALRHVNRAGSMTALAANCQKTKRRLLKAVEIRLNADVPVDPAELFEHVYAQPTAARIARIDSRLCGAPAIAPSRSTTWIIRAPSLSKARAVAAGAWP